MGPFCSIIGKNIIEITDLPCVVVSMRIMTHVTPVVLDSIGVDGEFILCVHSVRFPLKSGMIDPPAEMKCHSLRVFRTADRFDCREAMRAVDLTHDSKMFSLLIPINHESDQNDNG
jgi:GTP-dependent phosphoenolpyruvate carboxykinase